MAALVLSLGVAGCGQEVMIAEPGASCGAPKPIAGYAELRRCQPASMEHSLASNEEIQSVEGCQILEGGIIVFDSVTDLSPLSSLVVIEGNVSGGGYRFAPFDLDALDKLQVIGGDLRFLHDNITSFEGLIALHTIKGWLSVRQVPELETLRGLEKVCSLSRLDIKQNPNLRTLDGLDGLREVTGDVYIEANPQLPAAEVDAFLARLHVGGQIHRD